MLSLRKTYLICFALTLIIILLDGFLQSKLYLKPCLIVYLERIIFFAVGITFLASAIYNHSAQSKFGFGVLNFLLSLWGLVTSGRHVYLQYHPVNAILTASPEQYSSKIVYYLKLLQVTYIGTPNCSQVQWTFFYASLAQWRFLAFLLFAIVCVWQILRRTKNLVTE